MPDLLIAISLGCIEVVLSRCSQFSSVGLRLWLHTVCGHEVALVGDLLRYFVRKQDLRSLMSCDLVFGHKE